MNQQTILQQPSEKAGDTTPDLNWKAKLTGGQLKTLSSADYSNELDALQHLLLNSVNPQPKIVKASWCHNCRRHRPERQMSAFVRVFCRECVDGTRSKGARSKANLVDRLTNNFRSLLRRRLEVR